MIVNDLNLVLRFITNPNKDTFPGQEIIFDHGTREEYFLLKAGEINSVEIFQFLHDNYPNYFQEKFIEIAKKESLSGVLFYTCRFFSDVAKKVNNVGTYHLLDNEISKFIKTFENTSKSNHQAFWFVSLAIFELPLNLIKLEYLNFITTKALFGNFSVLSMSLEETLLPKVISEKEPSLLKYIINEWILGFDISTNQENSAINNISPRVEGYWLSKIINPDYIKSFGEVLGKEELLKISIEKLKSASKASPFSFSSIHIPTIEESSQIIDEYNFEFLLIKFIRTQLEVEDFGIDSTIRHLFESEVAVIRRLGVYLIVIKYDTYKDYFWNWWQENPLNDFELKPEIYLLLKTNSEMITKSELMILFNWINKLKIEKWDDSITDEDIKISKALTAKEFLSALNNVNPAILEELINKKLELKEITPHEREHPGYNFYMTTQWGAEYPDSIEEFNSNTDNAHQLVEYIINNHSSWTLFEIQGQLERLEQLVIEKPDIIKDVPSLLSLDYVYLSKIVYGLERAWSNNTTIDWEALIVLLKNIVNSENFTKESKERNSLVGYIGWLIKAILSDDNTGIPNTYLVDIKEICIKLVKLNIISERLNDDPFFDHLNSAEGKVLDATLSVLLRNARTNNRENEDKWFPDLKEYYTYTLESGNFSEAFLWNITGHLPQFGYLDFHWLERMINFIFPIKEEIIWTKAMWFYHRIVSRVYKDIFYLLLKNGHYDIGIGVFKDNQKGVSDFCKHIVISSMAGWEDQRITDNNSLLNKVISNCDESQIDGIITYLVRASEEDQTFTLDVWEKILTTCNLNDTTIPVKLLNLINALNQVDDRTFNIISLTLSYIKNKEEISQFIRSLNYTKKINIDFETRAKLLMLSTPEKMNMYFVGIEFTELAKNLYKINSELADIFVNDMVSKGIYQLLDVYNDYNKNIS